MKLRKMVGGLVVGLLLTSLATVVNAQNSPGPGPKGRGYGGPPQSPAERAARQEACPKRSGDCPAVCPNGGPGRGPAAGNGAGQRNRRGVRDGTGPCSANGTCPVAPSPSAPIN